MGADAFRINSADHRYPTHLTDANLSPATIGKVNQSHTGGMIQNIGDSDRDVGAARFLSKPRLYQGGPNSCAERTLGSERGGKQH
jgi:hypothetical protein